MNGHIARIQRCCFHDGPGIRTTVFFQGCPLNCAWCHNPETRKYPAQLMYSRNLCLACMACKAACRHEAHQWNEKGHFVEFRKCVACGACPPVCPAHALALSGKEMSPEEVMAVVKRDMPFYGAEGGVTFSGGDPLMQGEFLAELLRMCRSCGINTAVDTCGFCELSLIKTINPNVDLYLFDLKHADSGSHRHGTGVDNKQILSNLRFLIKAGKAVRIRIPLIPGFNDSAEALRDLAHLLRPWRDRLAVDLLPFHDLGAGKYEAIGCLAPPFQAMPDPVFAERKRLFVAEFEG